jgi:hypothetical protein
MTFDILPHHEEHLRAIGWQGEVPRELRVEPKDYEHAYNSWKHSLPDSDHETIHAKTIGTLAWKLHGPIGTKDVAPHIVQDAKLAESRAIRNHLREADITHFPALKKELDDIEDETRKAGIANVEAISGLNKTLAAYGSVTLREVRTLQSGAEKLAADSREDFADAVKLASRFGWAIIALLSILILCTLFAPRAHAQFSKINSITFQQDGSAISGAFFSYPFTINCTVNVTCSISGGKLTINSSGGTATPGGAVGTLQYNNAGALGGVTGSSVSGGSINLASTAVFSFNSDSGLSRCAAGVVCAGNGTAASFTGTFQATNYNVGNGASGYIGPDMFTTRSTGVFGATSGANATLSPDTGMSRCGVAIYCFGNGTAADFSGTIKATIVNAVTGFQVNGAATSGRYLKGDGTNFIVSSGSASGIGTPTACSNQFVTGFTLNSDAAPTSTCGSAAFGGAITNLSGDATTSGSSVVTLATKYKTSVCTDGIGDGLNAITAGTYIEVNCYNDFGATYTITGIRCFTDNNGSSTLNAANDAATGLLTGAVTCTNSWAAGTQSGTTTIASAHWIKFTFVADGTTKNATFAVTLTR